MIEKIRKRGDEADLEQNLPDELDEENEFKSEDGLGADFAGDEEDEQQSSSAALTALVSSMLFVSPRPITAEKISKAARRSLASVEAVLEELRDVYQEDFHGFSLHQVGDGWQFRTAPACAAAIRNLVPRKARRLSRAAAESLAIIAYKQPVDRAEIESIRGVDALPTLRTLLDGKLVRIVGKRDVPGQPALYGTTEKFLETFGLRDLGELPSLHELEQILTEPGEAQETSEDEEADSDDAVEAAA